MMPLMSFLHVLAVAVWIGGMVFAHFCLRPVAVQQLAPPQRLPLMAAVLGRFFALVAVAVVLILFTGFTMIGALGFKFTPGHWHAMMGIGLVMAAIFAYLYGVAHPRLKEAVARQDWPAGGAALDRIRKLVVVNLGLGTLTIAVATLGTLLVAH